MQYLGGKHAIAKPLAAHINSIIAAEGITHYIEPFCGACNIARHIRCDNMYLADGHYYLMALWQSVLSGVFAPPEQPITAELYADIRQNKQNYDPALVAFVGFGCSFGGKWFGGFARGEPGRIYSDEAWRSLQAKARDILYNPNVVLSHQVFDSDIWPAPVGKRALYYMDPPYYGTTGYALLNFSTADFVAACKRLARDNIVLLSEYERNAHVYCANKLDFEWIKPSKRALRGAGNTAPATSEVLIRIRP